MLLVWQLRGGDGRRETARQPAPPEADSPRKEPAGEPPPLPTWRTYYQAARQSPEALEALLDEHAEQLALSEPASWRRDLSLSFQEEKL